MQSKRNILILCSRSPVALEMIRSFYKAGHKVIVADPKSSALCRWSIYKHKFYLVPPPVQNFAGFKKAVENIVLEEEITDCIPIYEESFYVSKIKISLNCKVWISDFHLVNQLHRKDSFIELAISFFDTPITINYSHFSDFDNLSQYVFKPIYSRFANNIFIQPSKKEIEKGIKNKKGWVAQEFIEGDEICAYSIWDNGKMKGCCFYKPKFRFGKGASIYFEPEYFPELVDKIRSFGESLNYKGQLSFDFIEKNGKYFVLECNPRATSGAHIFGDKLAKIFFESSSNENIESSSKGLKLLMFLKQPSLMFSKKFRRAKDVLYDRKDIKPMLMQIFSIFEILILAWRKGITLLEATTYDIEWNGEKDKE